MSKKQIQKMGTRAGQAHYGVTCRMCPALYGRDNILAVGHLSRDGAEHVYAEHIATAHNAAVTA